MKVYPSEAWPAESTVLELDGTMDIATGLPFIAKGTGPTSSPSYEVQYNRRQMRQNVILAACRQGMLVDEGGLRVGVYPIDYTLGGQRKSFAGATGVSVPDNTHSVVYLDGAATLQMATAWPEDMHDYLPIAEITTAGGTMLIADRRMDALCEVSPPSRRCLVASCGQVGNSENALKVFEFEFGQPAVLEQVQVFCTAVTATAGADVRKAGVSMLSAPATPVAGSVVKPDIVDAVVVAGASVSVHVTTGAAGSVSNLSVVLVVRDSSQA